MIVRKLCAAILGASLGASLPASGQAQEGPPRPTNNIPSAAARSANQRLADAVAEQLRRTPALRHYQLDIDARDGVVELSGQVTDAAQQAEVVRLARTVPGVQSVRDRMRVAAIGEIVRAQVVIPPATLPLQPAPGTQPPAAQPPFAQPPVAQPGVPPAAPQVTPPGGAGTQEPTPLFQAPPGPNPAIQPPPLPPYAWPTFAPYNNYSRVATPNLYPYEAWPFIGPFYPFPRVPLGWRSVTLSWQDGHWWYGKNATGHDWWRVRYW